MNPFPFYKAPKDKRERQSNAKAEFRALKRDDILASVEAPTP